MAEPGISLLFDFFVAAQRLRRVLTEGLAASGMRPDEYAVYSLVFERGPLTATQMTEFLGMPLTTVLEYVRAMEASGHLVRTAHPFDGRATELSLNRRGIAAHRRANRQWEKVRSEIEGRLDVPLQQARRSIMALDRAAAASAVEQRRQQRRRHVAGRGA